MEYKQNRREGHRPIHKSDTMIWKRNQLRNRQKEIIRDGKTELFELKRIRTRGTIRSGACTSPWNDRID